MKPRQRLEELLTGDTNFLSFAGFHSRIDGLHGCQQFRMRWQSKRRDPVTFVKESEFSFGWWRIGEHGMEIGVSKISGFPAIPYFTCRNLRNADGSEGTSSCQVSILHRVRRVVDRMQRMTRYQCSSKSGQRASSNTQKWRLRGYAASTFRKS